MVLLTCPLCCNETFTCYLTLKDHILTLLQNLNCPSCNNKFGSIAELLEHLENEYLESLNEKNNESTIVEQEISEIPPETEKPSQYFCQMCNMQIDDVVEHLKSFHEGEDVIMEEDENVESEEYILGQEEDLQSDNVLKCQPPETFIDKCGQPYTRKLVKIDKFWVEESNKPNNSLIEINKCSLCNVYYPSGDAYEPHTCETSRKTEGPHNCFTCNTTFPTFKSLRLHKRMHQPVKKEHQQSSHAPDTFFCKICNKNYEQKFEAVHLRSHDPLNSFICEICNRKFQVEAHLIMHMKAHINNKKFVCSYCKKGFITEEGLHEHVSNQCHKRQYECQYCGRRFARPHEKVKHERIHTGEKPHVCDICGKAFRVSYCLTLHLRTHTGTRPYQCKICGKRFKSHSVHNHHLLTHSEVRAYQCPYCPKSFKTSVQLAGHKNSHLKPFSCTECNRPFASLYAVKSHMETHKRDNNLKYECWICGALYSRAFALRDHLKQQHHLEEQDDDERNIAEALVVDEEIVGSHSILTHQNIILGIGHEDNVEVIHQVVE